MRGNAAAKAVTAAAAAAAIFPASSSRIMQIGSKNPFFHALRQPLLGHSLTRMKDAQRDSPFSGPNERSARRLWRGGRQRFLKGGLNPHPFCISMVPPPPSITTRLWVASCRMSLECLEFGCTTGKKCIFIAVFQSPPKYNKLGIFSYSEKSVGHWREICKNDQRSRSHSLLLLKSVMRTSSESSESHDAREQSF